MTRLLCDTASLRIHLRAARILALHLFMERANIHRAAQLDRRSRASARCEEKNICRLSPRWQSAVFIIIIIRSKQTRSLSRLGKLHWLIKPKLHETQLHYVISKFSAGRAKFCLALEPAGGSHVATDAPFVCLKNR
jgi:hypothetical protein